MVTELHMNMETATVGEFADAAAAVGLTASEAIARVELQRGP